MLLEMSIFSRYVCKRCDFVKFPSTEVAQSTKKTRNKRSREIWPRAQAPGGVRHEIRPIIMRYLWSDFGSWKDGFLESYAFEFSLFSNRVVLFSKLYRVDHSVCRKKVLWDMARENAHFQQHAWGYISLINSAAMIKRCLWSKHFAIRLVFGLRTAFE